MMMNLSIKKVNNLQGGLCFQIGHITKELNTTYDNSIIVSEEAFCLIELEFMKEFSADEHQYNYYHWEHTSHDKQSTQRIIERLNHLKSVFINDIETTVSLVFRNDISSKKNYLYENKVILFEFIGEIVSFLEEGLENGNQGIHVYGI